MRRQRLYPVPLTIGGREVPPRTPGATLTPAGRWLILYRNPINDAEAFCHTAIENAFAEYNHFERPDEFEESLNRLIHILWGWEQTFDPERNDSFEGYVSTYIHKRAIDVGPRRILGRNGNRTHDYHHDSLDQSPHTHRPGHPLNPQQSDPSDDRRRDPGRLQTERDRQRARSLTILGLKPTRRAT